MIVVDAREKGKVTFQYSIDEAHKFAPENADNIFMLVHAVAAAAASGTPYFKHVCLMIWDGTTSMIDVKALVELRLGVPEGDPGFAVAVLTERSVQ